MGKGFFILIRGGRYWLLNFLSIVPIFFFLFVIIERWENDFFLMTPAVFGWAGTESVNILDLLLFYALMLLAF